MLIYSKILEVKVVLILQIYRENFEKAYIDATEQFYNVKAPDQVSKVKENKENGKLYTDCSTS